MRVSHHISESVKVHKQSQKVVKTICNVSVDIMSATILSFVHWLFGTHIKIRSSIHVGKFVGYWFVVMARIILCVVVYKLCVFLEPASMVDRAMISVQDWCDPVYLSIQARNNVPGAASMMKIKLFVLGFANSMFQTFTHILAIFNAVKNISESSALLTIAENMMMMPYSFASSYDTWNQLGFGSVSMATILWSIMSVEFWSIGLLSKYLEYLWYNRQEHISEEYRDIVTYVLGEKIPLSTAHMFQKSPAFILFEQAIEIYQPGIKKLRADNKLQADNICQGTFKNGKKCTYKAKYGNYCKRHCKH